jgi:alkylation response protein AidB-like acyl-CoA dehydrogenase
MPPDALQSLDIVLPEIRRRANLLDQTGDWPADDLRTLADIGAMRWGISPRFGGIGLSPLDLHLCYERLASASLTLALILTQRDSAAGLMEAGDSPTAGTLLRQLADDEVFCTVGIAQLTTSRQGGPPVMTARHECGRWRVDGLVPWCTGAARAAFIVCGAAIENGDQILFLLPASAPGVTIDPPMPLIALRASGTTSLHCEGVKIGDELILKGPAAKVLAPRPNALPLGQAYLATGLCQGARDLIAAHNSAAARAALGQLDTQLQDLRGRIIALSAPGFEAQAADEAPLLRGRCNDLALRMTHAAVTLYKGAALLAGHPAQRLAREALFLLVWSCPSPVIDCTVDLLTARR